MTAPTEKAMNYGLRFVEIFELNPSDNSIKGTGLEAYDGYQIRGSTTYEMNVPDSRTITGLGEDGVTVVVALPPQDAVTGTLTVEAADPVLAALIDGTKLETVGEVTLAGLGTDKQGFEPTVGMMLSQAAKGLVSGKTYWHTYFIPSTAVIRKGSGMGAEKATTKYQILPNRVSKHLWGTALSIADNGYESTQVLEAWSNYPLKISAFVADGTAVDFPFPANAKAVQTTGIVVYKNDVKVTTGLTLAVDKVTFSSAPTAGDRIVILREVAKY